MSLAGVGARNSATDQDPGVVNDRSRNGVRELVSSQADQKGDDRREAGA